MSRNVIVALAVAAVALVAGAGVFAFWWVNTTGIEVDWDKIDAEQAARERREEVGPTLRLGATISFPDADWVVVSAKDLGNSLKNGDNERHTEGRFVDVRFTVTNKTADQAILFEPARLLDATGKDYADLDVQDQFLPEGTSTVTMFPMPPGSTTEFGAIYEVPANGAPLSFECRSLDAFEQKTQKVELGV